MDGGRKTLLSVYSPKNKVTHTVCIFLIFDLHTHKDTRAHTHTHIQTYILELSNECLSKQLTQDCVGKKSIHNTNNFKTLKQNRH